MRAVFTSILLSATILSFGQNYNFKPQWKQGETKTITIVQTEREYEDDKLISDTASYNDARIKVLKDKAESYTLEVKMENQVLRSVMDLYESVGDELPGYRDLKFVCVVNKETSASEIENWEEVRDFMNNSIEQTGKLLEEKAPEIAPFMGLVFMPLKAAFDSKETIEEYFDDQFGYILTPFNKNFELGQAISETETDENPFKPGLDISTTTLLTLNSVNSKENSCKITQEVILDLSAFNEMMKGMLQRMAESFGSSDSTIAESTLDLDKYKMDVKNSQEITFDIKSTWVTKVVTTGIVSGYDPQAEVKNRKEVITTTTIN